jgi:hypothetical protein
LLSRPFGIGHAKLRIGTYSLDLPVHALLSDRSWAASNTENFRLDEPVLSTNRITHRNALLLRIITMFDCCQASLSEKERWSFRQK